MEATSDTLLVAAARNGDHAAYGELFTRYQSRIYNYAYGIAGNRDDAADIAQEAFARVFEALPRVTGELNFSAYVYRTAHNVAIDTVKGRSRFEDPEALDVQMEPSLRADPERVALVQEQQHQAWQAAFRLTDDHRAILTLRELHDLSYQEIAEIMDMPRNTVGVLLSRARLRFKEAFRMSSVDIDKLTAECQDMLPLLSAYIDDELDEQKRARVESHLEQCAFCRLALEEMTESSRSYRAILPLLPPAGLGKGLWLRLGDGATPTQTASSTLAAPPTRPTKPFQNAPPGQPTLPFGAARMAQPLDGTGGFPISLNMTGSGIPSPKSSRRDPLPWLLTVVGGVALILVLVGVFAATGVLGGRGGGFGADSAVTTSTTESAVYGDFSVDTTTVSTTSTVSHHLHGLRPHHLHGLRPHHRSPQHGFGIGGCRSRSNLLYGPGGTRYGGASHSPHRLPCGRPGGHGVHRQAPLETRERSQRSDLLGGGAILQRQGRKVRDFSISRRDRGHRTLARHRLHQRTLAGDGHRWRREFKRTQRLGQVRTVDRQLATDDSGAPVHHDYRRPVLTGLLPNALVWS